MAQKQIIIWIPSKGVILDVPPDRISNEHCSNARHIRFEDGLCSKMPGYSSFYSTADSNAIIGLFTFQDEYGNIVLLSGTKSSMAKIVNGNKTVLSNDYNGYDDEDVTHDATPWSFAAFGKMIIFANGIDPVQKLEPPYNSVGDLGGDPPVAGVVKVFQRHVMLFAIPAYPYRVVWSDIDNPEIFTPAPENEAGDVDLFESKTPIIGGDTLGDVLVIYTANQIHVFQYIGGTFVFNRRIASWDVGLWKKNLLATVEDLQFFMSRENFYAFDGTRLHPIGDPINKEVFGALHTGKMSRGFVFPLKKRGEVWFCLPLSSGDGTPNLACIYNYRNGSWTFDDISWTSAIDRLPNSYPLFAHSDKKIYALEVTENADGNAITGYVDSPEFRGETPELVNHIVSLYPEVVSSASTIKFKLGTRNNINETVSWSDPYTFNPATDRKVDIRSSARLARIRVYTDTLNSPFSISRILIAYQILGER